jgi:hypothetical protein
MSVDTKATCHTTTGQNGLKILLHRLFLTGARQVYPETANTLLDGDLGAFLAKRAAWSPSIRQTEEAVSSRGRSKSVFIGSRAYQLSANQNSWKLNLGPIQTTVKGVKPNPQADGLGYNPRCLSRDMNTQASKETRDELVVDLIKNYPDILSFQNKMQNFTLGVMGVHNGGHYTIGGDSGMDMYAALYSLLSAKGTY